MIIFLKKFMFRINCVLLWERVRFKEMLLFWVFSWLFRWIEANLDAIRFFKSGVEEGYCFVVNGLFCGVLNF